MNKSLNLISRLHISSGGEFLCTPSWNSEVEICRNYMKFYLPIEGEALLFNKNFKLKICPNNLYIIPPYLPIGTSCENSMLVHWLHVKIEDRQLSMFFSRIKKISSLNLNNDLSIASAFSNACGVLGNNPNVINQDCHINNQTEMLQIHSALLLIISKLIPKEGITGDQKINHICNALETNTSEPLDLDHIAKSFSWSTPHLRKYFRERVGQTPAVYHENQRIIKAQSLMNDNTQSIAQIARECGWEDPLYFSKVFKNKVGLCPRDYRNKGFQL